MDDIAEFLEQVRADHMPDQYAGMDCCFVCLDAEWPCSTERLARAVEAVLAYVDGNAKKGTYERPGTWPDNSWSNMRNIRTAIAEALKEQ